MPAIPDDYAERVYAGVLGKLIGVYLGRPFEGWSYERIMRELGPINFYVNERRDVALRSHHLVVTDDDISVLRQFETHCLQFHVIHDNETWHNTNRAIARLAS